MSDKHFGTVIDFPDPDASERYENLFGLDEIKQTLEKEAEALLRPDLLEKWSNETYGFPIPALNLVLRRPPLFIFAGDVGTGKTELALTCGDRLARKLDIPVQLLSLSLRTRGAGAVGEMTDLISGAFAFIRSKCPKHTSGKKPTSAFILLIDEGDSLAQSRGLSQMHHEDRVGVNALIRGIDDIASAKIPCVTILCSNRLNALDPAVQRRAAAVFEFKRPDLEMRELVLAKHLDRTGLTTSDISAIAAKMGENKLHKIGYTFSDITQRIIPTAVLNAYPDQKITKNLILDVIQKTPPTPQFVSED